MVCLTPPVSDAVRMIASIHVSTRAAALPAALHCAPLAPLPWTIKGPMSLQQRHHFLSVVSRQHGFCKLQNTGFHLTWAMDMSAERSGSSKKLGLDAAIDSLRLLWSRCPQPVKRFPWMRTAHCFFQLISELVVAVAKFLCVPLLAVSSLSEMSYCAHERKMVVIPIPFLAGIAVAKILKETAVELSPSFKELEFPWHLLLIATFFVLLKFLGPYYPYWGRLSIPHFANGGMWTTLFFAFSWYRRPRHFTMLNEASETDCKAE